MDNIIQFPQIAIRIIRAQAMVIGPLAWDAAKKVPGFHIIDQNKGDVSFDGDAKEVLNRLVAQYEQLFGKLSDEVCKEAVQDIISKMPADEIPESLK